MTKNHPIRSKPEDLYFRIFRSPLLNERQIWQTFQTKWLLRIVAFDHCVWISQGPRAKWKLWNPEKVETTCQGRPSTGTCAPPRIRLSAETSVSTLLESRPHSSANREGADDRKNNTTGLAAIFSLTHFNKDILTVESASKVVFNWLLIWTMEAIVYFKCSAFRFMNLKIRPIYQEISWRSQQGW